MRCHLAPLHASFIGQGHDVTLGKWIALLGLSVCALITGRTRIQVAVLQPSDVVSAKTRASAGRRGKQQKQRGCHAASLPYSHFSRNRGSTRSTTGASWQPLPLHRVKFPRFNFGPRYAIVERDSSGGTSNTAHKGRCRKGAALISRNTIARNTSRCVPHRGCREGTVLAIAQVCSPSLVRISPALLCDA